VVALTSKIDCHLGLSEVVEEKATAVGRRRNTRSMRRSRRRRGEEDD
jgi:hypothetical protein